MKKHLDDIEECSNEIIELLRIGGCQRHLILDEVEMILRSIQELRQTLDKD